MNQAVKEQLRKKLDSTDPIQKEKLRALLMKKKSQSKTIIHQIFEAQVAKTPDKIAIECEGQQTTYAQLNGRANQLAGELIAEGVRVGDIVAISLNRSIDLIVAILATLKAGAAYLPLDPMSPNERINGILDDAKAQYVITESEFLDIFAASEGVVLTLDKDELALSLATRTTDNNVQPSQHIRPGDLAYIIYTSGSTGKPKGVMVEHHNVTRLLTATETQFGFNENDVWTLFHSYAFDFSVWEIWGALLNGAKLVVVPYLVSRSPEKFYELLAKEKVTVLNQTPSAFSNLQKQVLHGAHVLSLRYVIFGGEALEPNFLASWFERFGDQNPALINMYGITETTVHVTYKKLSHKDLESNISNIGRPLSDLSYLLLDSKMRQVPEGAIGELYIGGGGLTRGYLNQALLTSQRFIENPFSRSELVYKTGDQVRQLANGELEYIGRIDNQVKLRGFRIELDEITSKLFSYKGITEAVCVVKGESDERKIVAYIVSNDLINEHTKEQWKPALHAHLSFSLPEYMIPSAVVCVSALPLNINGKVDSEAFPMPLPEDYWTQKYVAPCNDIENSLCEIFAELFQLDSVGTGDSFFALGGDSLQTVNLVAKAAEQGLHFSISDVFSSRTIAELARAVQQDAVEKFEYIGEFELVLTQDRAKLPDGIVSAYPMSSLQQGMVYHNLASEDNSVFHNVINQSFIGSFDGVIWRQTIVNVMKRHEILRTSFLMQGVSVPLQLVHEDVAPPLQVIDVKNMSAQEQERRLAQAMLELRQSRFDLNKAPLFKCVIYCLSDNKFELFWVEHHAILDGWSLASLMTQISNEYMALKNDQVNDVTIPEGTYRSFIKQEQLAVASDEQRAFWQSYVADAEFTRISRVDKKHESCRPIVSEMLPTELFSHLNQLAKQMEVPFKTLFLTAYMKVISLFSGKTEVMAGVSGHCRPDTLDSNHLLGLYVTTLPLVMSMKTKCWEDLIKECFHQEQKIWAHRYYPLAEIIKHSQHQELFETAFTFNNFHITDEASELGLQADRERDAYEVSNFSLGVAFLVQDMEKNQCMLQVDYDSSLFDHALASRVFEYLLLALESIAADITAPVNLMIESDVQQLNLINQTEKTYPKDKTLGQLFKEQVEKTPSNIALVFADEQWTYQELDQQSNRLAHYIQGLGVSEGGRVGIALERSSKMIISILAVLKAGATYVPLDPTYPIARLSHMISDSHIACILTEKAQSDLLSAGIPGNIISAFLDQLDDELQGYSALTPELKNSCSESTAYIVYTSGSTGVPKGVALAHKGAVNMTLAQQKVFNVQDNSRVLHFASIGFDAATSEWLMALLSGAGLYVCDEATRQSSLLLHEFLLQHKISHATIPPVLLTTLEIDASYYLETLIVAGESCDEQEAKQWAAKYNVFNAYGPSECTVCTHIAKISADAPITVGYPIDNIRAYVLDANFTPVPSGVIGELFIAGDGLAQGYLAKPELTREKFIELNINGCAESLYRTGDLVRMLNNGSLEFIGRVDSQINIKGFRVELGEIEQHLRKIDEVQSALVLLVEDSPQEKYLVAYIIADDSQGSSALQSRLRQELRKTIPDYMIPSFFVVMEQWPLTTHGKVDKKVLPVPDKLSAQEQYVPPKSNLEIQLTAIWGEMLGVDTQRLSASANFFEIGGHSLLLTRLIMRICEQFDSALLTSEVLNLQAFTIIDMAALISAKRQMSEGMSVAHSNKKNIEEMEF
ncbi:hypothetical protein PPRY_a2267 [Pseudoalteromonas prydzensis ACAM 620]|uniref:non-ribosomal peptide synthetase n=1 Tax=Pseudoalteromonas prydzensis TaxID=182141 RepID=UPI0007E51A95|nr:non-ribosomal peptide synthetase [Pseudoalteromonas prydzensis]MBE0377185.1 hypothetical protein [Pseudoalteromonas prydzensis ACAM 620]